MIRCVREAIAAPMEPNLTAEEIVSGTFRNIAGTINSVDASSSTLNVHDLLSKKNVVVKITPIRSCESCPLRWRNALRRV